MKMVPQNFLKDQIKGKIVKPHGDKGYGWDPIFLPDGFDKTFGEMTIEYKAGISMRSVAFKKLADFISKL